MKKLLSLIFVLLTLPAFGQQVDSSQLKLKTDAGLGGDTSNALGIKVYQNTTAPASPLTGELWCDTNFSPCILKTYNGSSWVAPQGNASIQTQANMSSLPGSPVDGQIFLSKSPHMICVYDDTATYWYCSSTMLQQSGPNIADVYSSATMSSVDALSAAASATAGSLSAGTYSYKVTCRNGTGGETQAGTVSNTITSLVSKSADLSSIPICTGVSGSGTITRGIYRSKVNLPAAGPWYWVYTISDNTTTTLNDGVADSALVYISPDINFSGALPGNWVVTNTTAATTSGGCGVTTRNTMACQGSNSLTPYMNTSSTDSTVRAALDITSYAAGNYTVQYRIKLLSKNGTTYGGSLNNAIWGIRNGTGDTAIRAIGFVGSYHSTITQTMPFSASVHGAFDFQQRTTVGAAAGNVFGYNPWPEVDGWPLWVRIVKSGASILIYTSSDGLNWTGWVHGQSSFGNAAPNTTSALGLNSVFGNSTTQIELDAAEESQSGVIEQDWIEIDSFTLTVN